MQYINKVHPTTVNSLGPGSCISCRHSGHRSASSFKSTWRQGCAWLLTVSQCVTWRLCRRLEKPTAVLIVLQILQMSTKACQICRCQPNPIPSIPSIPHFGPGWAHTFPSTMTTSTTAETPINSPVRSTKYSPGAKKLTKLLNLTRFQQRPVSPSLKVVTD